MISLPTVSGFAVSALITDFATAGGAMVPILLVIMAGGLVAMVLRKV